MHAGATRSSGSATLPSSPGAAPLAIRRGRTAGTVRLLLSRGKPCSIMQQHSLTPCLRTNLLAGTDGNQVGRPRILRPAFSVALLPFAAPLQPHRLQLRLGARHLGEAVLAVHGVAVGAGGSRAARRLIPASHGLQQAKTSDTYGHANVGLCVHAREILTAPIALQPICFRDRSNGPRAGINFNDVSIADSRAFQHVSSLSHLLTSSHLVFAR
jgi:hypothetical protein